MSKKPERTKTVVKVLDKEARTRQLRHHLDSLERDNFVALNEYEAIIATAAAAASAPGPVSLTTTNLGPHGLLPPMSPAVGSLVGGIAGTVGPGAAMPGSGPILGSRSKKQTGAGAIGANNTPSSYAALGHRKPVLPRKPLNQLLEESGLARQDPVVVSYLTASVGPSQYPHRQFCSVCGWKGTYRCSRCGMRYCDLRCLKTHEDTRCMKFTI
ncbi:MAG: hypothetical protein BYD32DRAFT_423632 [Podila humilis]|nr:MAG: hypothetical protein BYD32DRAFT_423632 [Podila humilis]